MAISYIRDDLNFPSNLLQQAARALEPGVPANEVNDIAMAIRAELKLGQENSPYAEVKIYQPALKSQIVRKIFTEVFISEFRFALASTLRMTPQHRS